MRPERHTVEPYTGIVRLGIREVTRRLLTALGPTLVSALAGGREATDSLAWARADGPEPGPAAQPRLLLAHQAWNVESSAEGEEVARLWFIGANPCLTGISPIEAISQARSEDVMNAAHAMAEGKPDV